MDVDTYIGLTRDCIRWLGTPRPAPGRHLGVTPFPIYIYLSIYLYPPRRIKRCMSVSRVIYVYAYIDIDR